MGSVYGVKKAEHPVEAILPTEGLVRVGRQRHAGHKTRHLEFLSKRHHGQGGVTEVAAIRDVTERQQIEETLAQAQIMESVGQLAGGVAHDFNNLLTVILGYSDVLHDVVPAEHRHALERMQTAGHHAASLTAKLLAYGRKQLLESVTAKELEAKLQEITQ